MTRALVLALCLAAALPAAAEEKSELEEGTDLMQEGAKLLFRGLMSEMAPAIDRMEQLARVLGDLDAYYPPEVLPNGDVILRRKVPLLPGPPGQGAPEGDIDL